MTSVLSDRPAVGRLEPVRLQLGMTPEEIYAAYGLTCPPRVGTLRDPSRKTYGTAVSRIAVRLGQPPMPWQRYAADVALEVDPATGWLAYRDVTLIVPRQSGKTTTVLSVKVHRALKMGSEAAKYRPAQGPQQFILYAAQKLLSARTKFVEEQLPLLERSPFAARFRKRMANGSESLRWDTGALDGITANTETSGHGPSLDLGVEDEFWAAEDHRLEQAFSPAMITRWSPQHWRVSTEGTPRSTYMAEKVESGRLLVASGEPTQICYLEWSDLDGPRDDPATWLRCMPALCPTPGECDCSPVWRHTVTLDVIAGELEKFAGSPDEFDRAYLNRRQGLTKPPDPNLPTKEQWTGQVNKDATPGDVVAFGIEITRGRDAGAIMAAWPGEGRTRHWRVIEYRPGIDWIAGRAAELDERWDPVAWGLDIVGPGRVLLPDLKEAGLVEPSGEPVRGQLYCPNTRDFAAGCGLVATGIRDGWLWHQGEEAINAAFTVARTRPLGDSWAWERKAGDCTTLIGGTVALSALEERKHLPARNTYDPLANLG